VRGSWAAARRPCFVAWGWQAGGAPPTMLRMSPTSTTPRLHRCQINGAPTTVRSDPQQPLLWVLRDELGLVGSKYGCGIGVCGACMVLVNGQPRPACVVPVAEVAGQRITTVEGLAPKDRLHPVQQAWIEHNVPQCGYCQSGQMVSAAALLARHPQPTDAQIDEALRGNLCRCGTYARIRSAVHRAAELMKDRQA
jgi:isoquinoline 1-oxidoreductase subunit alpha